MLQTPTTAKDFPLDSTEAKDTGFFCCGTSQCGKTTLGKHIAGLLISHGITVYVLDVSRAWVANSPIAHTLTVPHNGNEVEVAPHQSTVLDLSLARAKYAYMRTNDGLSMLATITSQ